MRQPPSGVLSGRCPAPEYWLRFLSELLEPEDIPALQEYLLLLDSVHQGPEMLMLIGKGGEGKAASVW